MGNVGCRFCKGGIMCGIKTVLLYLAFSAVFAETDPVV